MEHEHQLICPLRLTMNIAGGKWCMSIICLLGSGKPMRFTQILRRISGITHAMLSQSLKQLEEYGIISREQFNEVPVRVEYRLTESGKSLLVVLEQIAAWGNRYIQEHPEYESRCQSCSLGE